MLVCMKNKNIYQILITIVFFIGLFGRLYIAVSVPIWHDEARSILTATAPLHSIATGELDPGHTPGYYVFLKTLFVISDHLLFLRLVTILLYIANFLLIYRFIKQVVNQKAGFIAASFYALSGYFVIFDWQVRMYTPILSLMLLSLLYYQRISNRTNNKKWNWIIFSLINIAGLYLDYAYIWYLLPLLLISCYRYLYQGIESFKKSASIIVSSLSFFLLYPQVLNRLNQGMDSINWIKPYMSPSFSIPYFFGILQQGWFPAIICIATMILVVGVVQKNKNETISTIMKICLISLIVTLTCSIMGKPLFHVRSLQIVGLSVSIITSYALSCLNKKYTWIITASISIQALIFAYSIQTIIDNPGRALISYFPWKRIASQDLKQYAVIRYTDNTNSQDSLYIWSLDYTLSGKESYPYQSFIHQKSQPSEIEISSCTIIQRGLVDLYGCKK